MSDFTDDTIIISSSLLNDNSIHFLNYGTNDISNNTKKLLNKYFTIVDKCEDYCLTSSVIMELYGLRNARDIDYLHREDKYINEYDIGLHSGKWLKYYSTHKDDIIYNPENHFYINGHKLSSLDIIKKMKESRNEKKDTEDIKLLYKFL